MRFNMKQPIIVFTIVSLVFFPFGSAALAEGQHNHEEDIRMAGDILIARPLGFIATIGGTVLFVVALPFSILGGNTEEVYEQLVVKPAKYTFVRPVGHFD